MGMTHVDPAGLPKGRAERWPCEETNSHGHEWDEHLARKHHTATDSATKRGPPRGNRTLLRQAINSDRKHQFQGRPQAFHLQGTCRAALIPRLPAMLFAGTGITLHG